jgi:hypothetical protein
MKELYKLYIRCPEKDKMKMKIISCRKSCVRRRDDEGQGMVGAGMEKGEELGVVEVVG